MAGVIFQYIFPASPLTLLNICVNEGTYSFEKLTIRLYTNFNPRNTFMLLRVNIWTYKNKTCSLHYKIYNRNIFAFPKEHAHFWTSQQKV